MEIKDERQVWEECRKEVSELITGITKETSKEQEHRYLHDAYYHSSIDYLTQMLFTIKTDKRFIELENNTRALHMYHEMKSRLKLYGVDID